MTTTNEFESTWNEGEESAGGATAAAMTAKRMADEAAAQKDFANTFTAETIDAGTKADIQSDNVPNTAVDVPIVQASGDGKTTDITKAAE